MMYNRERGLPWHGLGNGVEGARTAKQAIIDAGLDWEVELRKVFAEGASGNKILLPGHHAVTRTSDDRVLGVVKSRYTPFQNREAFEFADALVDSGDAKYDTAGSLRGGRVVFLSMQVPNHILVGGEDAHDMYLMLRTSHDGTTAIGVYVVIIRPVCMNTVTFAISGAKHRWSMPHVSTLQGKLQEARETLQLSFSYADAFQEQAEALMNVKVSDDAAVDILTDVLPTRPKTDEKIDEIMECLRTSERNGYHGTGWGLVNAVTEYHQHWRTGTQPEATFFNVMDGEIRKWRDGTAQRLLSTV
jgi:phage/plasmid-like protein (TIGR03299 family)